MYVLREVFSYKEDSEAESGGFIFKKIKIPHCFNYCVLEAKVPCLQK